MRQLGTRTRTNHARHGGPAAILFLCLFAAQAGQLALTAVLADVARAFGVSTAEAGQIRTAAAVVAATAAIAVAWASARVPLGALLLTGIALVTLGAGVSLVAPSLLVLTAGQALSGAASSILVASGVAAAAEWSDAADRGRVVAWTLVGAPAAWVAAMPVIGLVGASSWRLAFVVPIAAAVVAGLALRRAPASPTPVTPKRGRALFVERRLRAWAAGEVLAYAAWSGVLVYAGALFVESYGTPLTVVGLALGLGAAAYIPGTFVAQRLPAVHGRRLLAMSGLLLAGFVVAFGVLRLGSVVSALGFGVLCFLAGARTYLGSAVGLELAAGEHASAMSIRAAAAQVGWILGSATGGTALSAGGYSALAVVLALLFVGATLAHVRAIAAFTRRGRARATPSARLRREAAPARAR